MSAAPARILGLQGGKIEVGEVADLMIADLDEKWIVDPANFVSKGKNNPFGGYELCGVVKYTIVDGEVKYQA
jgi:dihydroorotase